MEKIIATCVSKVAPSVYCIIRVTTVWNRSIKRAYSYRSIDHSQIVFVYTIQTLIDSIYSLKNKVWPSLRYILIQLLFLSFQFEIITHSQNCTRQHDGSETFVCSKLRFTVFQLVFVKGLGNPGNEV